MGVEPLAGRARSKVEGLGTSDDVVQYPYCAFGQTCSYNIPTPLGKLCASTSDLADLNQSNHIRSPLFVATLALDSILDEVWCTELLRHQ